MKTLFPILFMLISLGLQQSSSIETKRIVTKFHVMDEDFSPEWFFCDEPPKPFLIMDSHDCSFTIDNNEYDINEKWTLDSSGGLKEYWDYKPMGPLIYERSDFDDDQKLSEYIGVDNVQIQISNNSNYIYDSGDTLEIETVFEKEKLIFIKRTSEMKDNQIRLIYQYE